MPGGTFGPASVPWTEVVRLVCSFICFFIGFFLFVGSRSQRQNLHILYFQLKHGDQAKGKEELTCPPGWEWTSEWTVDYNRAVDKDGRTPTAHSVRVPAFSAHLMSVFRRRLGVFCGRFVRSVRPDPEGLSHGPAQTLGEKPGAEESESGPAAGEAERLGVLSRWPLKHLRPCLYGKRLSRGPGSPSSSSHPGRVSYSYVSL